MSDLPVAALAISLPRGHSGPDGQYGALGSADHAVCFCVWDIACKAASSLRAHDDQICFRFFGDSQNLVDGLPDCHFKIQFAMHFGFGHDQFP